ncbi:MAG TPA: trypsin-like peptidase domain-containing protein [Bryobacteraceae bacterium]|nr:trypsin-like peptidase domain-containing protein [Bryobacteraceae bacterium]
MKLMDGCRDVGRSPRTAADAPVGLYVECISTAGPGGPARTRASALRSRLAALLIVAASCAFGQSATDKMLQSSVAVFGTVDKKPVSRGGGFMIDSRHVVTNLTACCGKTAQPVVVAGDKDASTAKVVWSSEETEMAILELKDPIDRPALIIAPFKTIEKDQTVFTAQYPDPGESGTTPKLTEGKILSLVKIENSAVQVYKTSASMNKANSGGALFDACGNVIGINMMMKDGAEFAYVVDPLLEGLKAAGLTATVTRNHCGSAAAPASGSEPAPKKDAEASKNAEWWGPKGAEWIPVALLIAAIAMAFRTPRNKVSQARLRYQALPDPASYAPLTPPLTPSAAGNRPALHGAAGQYEGKSFSLDAGPSVLGRDQRAANLVFAPEADSISKRHCMVSWDAARRTFVIQDLGSTNGTFLATGERLTPGVSRDLAAGGRFYIGDLRNQFEVRME